MENKVHRVMSEFKAGQLHSGSKDGPKVKSRPQAIAIALSAARRQRRDAHAQHVAGNDHLKKVAQEHRRGK